MGNINVVKKGEAAAIGFIGIPDDAFIKKLEKN